MKKYLFLLIAALAFLTPSASLYAQDVQPLPTTAAEVEVPATALNDAPADAISSAGLLEPELEDPAKTLDETLAEHKAPRDPLDTAGEVIQSVRAGNWRDAVAGILFLLMLGLGKYREEVKWFKGDRGGAFLVLALGVGGGIVTTLYAAGPLDWRLFVGSISVAFTSAGGYTVIKKIIWPSDREEESEA